MNGYPANESASTHPALSLLGEAIGHGITLWVEGDFLRYRAPSSLSDPLRKELQAHKRTLIELLSGPAMVIRGNQREVPFLVFYHGLWDKIRTGRLGVTFTNMHWAVELRGEQYDLAFLERGAQWLLARHSILSARLSETSGVPRFVIDARAGIEFMDISDLPAEIRAARAQETLDEVTWRPFRAEVDTLFRPFVIRLARDSHYAGFVLNHLIGDAFSIDIIARELLSQWSSNSNALQSGVTAQHPLLQYSDYVLATNEWLESQALPARMLYWKAHLSGGSHCRLPPDRIVDADEWCEVARFDFCLGLHQTKRVLSAARRLCTTPYSVLLAAHAKALGQCADHDDVILLSLHHGRETQTWRTVGSFQNHLVLRIQSRKDDSFDSLVERCQEEHLASEQNVVPYHYVRGILPGLGIRERFPEFQYWVLQEPGQQASSEPSTTGASDGQTSVVEPRVPDSRSRIGDFPDHKLTCYQGRSDIGVRVNYLPAEHDESSIMSFVAAFRNVIDAIA